MPIVSFKPTKARLVIEESKESVLVMKIALALGDTVELATGDKLEKLIGVARVRERAIADAVQPGEAIGALVYVPRASQGQLPPKYQINISVAPNKFDALLKMALAGRLPSRFFVVASESNVRGEAKGMGYRVDAVGRAKYWDNRTFRSLALSGFSMILPIDVPEASSGGTERGGTVASSGASREQVTELANDLAVFHGETKHILTAVVSLFAVMAVLALLFNLVLLFR
jgi:hypothetical protein